MGCHGVCSGSRPYGVGSTLTHMEEARGRAGPRDACLQLLGLFCSCCNSTAWAPEHLLHPAGLALDPTPSNLQDKPPWVTLR